MKIFIDGYSFVAESITKKLINNHYISTDDIYILTYSDLENAGYRNFLDITGLNYDITGYSKEIVEKIILFNPDYVISLYARRIVPNKVIRSARRGTFNLHPSLLPDYKGCFSAPWVIINRESETGITIHELSNKIDSGKILFQKRIKVSDNETGFSLYNKLASNFINEFDLFFNKLINNEIKSTEMPDGGKYYPRALPFNGIINENWSYKKIDAFIRAMFFPPFKGACIEVKNKNIEFSSINEYKVYKRIG